MTEWNLVDEPKLPATSFMMRTPCVKLLEDEWPESITPHDVRQTCLAPAWHMRKLLCSSCFAQVPLRKLQRAQLALRKLLCASCSGQGALRKLVCASLRKLLCASCPVQVALCKLLRASCSVQVGPCKWLPASCSVQITPCKLLPARRSAPTGLCKLLCASCSAQTGLCNLLCASCSAQVALCKLLRAACEARPRTRGESNPRPTGPGSRRANHETSRGPARTTKVAKNASFCTSTTPIPAEGRASQNKIATNLELKTKSQKNLEFLYLDRADPRKGSRGPK